MTKPEHVGLCVSIFLLTGITTVPTYAFYRNQTSQVSNPFNTSPVSVIHFSSNGGNGSMEDLYLPLGHGYRVPENTLSNPGSVFLEWNTQPDGSGVPVPEHGCVDVLPFDSTNTVLYAQWDDESGGVLEPYWNKNYELDKDKDGVPDRLQLKVHTNLQKDPSVKNHSSKAAYAYMLVSVPTVRVRPERNAPYQICDLFHYYSSNHWKHVKSLPSDSVSEKSNYLYRYEMKLEPEGSTQSNPYTSGRFADRTTDLFSKVYVNEFASADAVTDSIDLTAVLIEANASAAEADRMAIESFISAGLLGKEAE